MLKKIKQRNRASTLLLWAVFLALFGGHALAQKGQFYTTEEFHQLAFPNSDIKWQTLWVTSELREKMSDILGRDNTPLRLRYWGEGDTSAWIFNEIGKEHPITVGVVVRDGKIDQLEVLEYRESRGGEVRYPFFTSQFVGLGIEHKGADVKLNGKIDGITGATLSVRALRKIATLALFCHQQTPFAETSEQLRTVTRASQAR